MDSGISGFVFRPLRSEMREPACGEEWCPRSAAKSSAARHGSERNFAEMPALLPWSPQETSPDPLRQAGSGRLVCPREGEQAAAAS